MSQDVALSIVIDGGGTRMQGVKEKQPMRSFGPMSRAIVGRKDLGVRESRSFKSYGQAET